LNTKFEKDIKEVGVLVDTINEDDLPAIFLTFYRLVYRCDPTQVYSSEEMKQFLYCQFIENVENHHAKLSL
jgi:hypothetical protein